MPAPRLSEKLGKIEGQAERLHRLINALLDVSRIASGRLELEIEDVDLSQLASRGRGAFPGRGGARRLHAGHRRAGAGRGPLGSRRGSSR